MQKKIFSFGLSLLAATLSGCTALSPGMHMNTRELTPTVNGANQVVQSHIKVINADLILKQKQQADIAKQVAIAQYQKPDGFTTNTKNYSYKIAPQDTLQIIVWNQSGGDDAGLSASTGGIAGAIHSGSSQSSDPKNSFIVNSNGSIFYPFLGSIHVAGKSVSEVRKLISKRMSRFLTNPQVTVTMLSFNSQRVAVTGAVVKPTTISLTNVPLNVLTAVTEAGGPIRCGATTTLMETQTICADLHDVEIRRGSRTVQVNLNTLNAINGSSNNWLLKDGDVIYVPNNNASRVFVLGSVNSPNPYNMIDGKMTLREALGDARGMASGSNPKFTYVIRDYNQKPEIYLLNLASPDALNLAGEFNLKPSDIVYVSTSALHNFSEIMGEISPTLLSAAAIKSLTN